MENNSTAKRLAKNTVYMYLRMALLMLISLYTSRVVLRELGVEDYGVYSLVGSIVAIFSSLRGLFASSTQRFLNYEMGRKADEKLKVVFNMSVVINLIIAFIFVVGVEIVGYWFFENKINIDPTRLYAAKWVFQFSVLTVVLSILATPFDALIIAHEKMNFYAILSIAEGIMKLVVVFALALTSYDKLIFYGFLHVVVSIVVIICNFVYCRCKFPESRFSNKWDRVYFKQMSTFAGWNFLGNTAYSLTQSGLNMVLNVFGGPIVNAARGIAYQIQTISNTFMTNVNIVVNPYFIKTYAAGNSRRVFSFMYMATKIFYSIQLCITIVICYNCKDILTLWLGQVPEYTVVFTIIILTNCLIRSIHYPIDSLFKAVGNLKRYQLYEGVILSLPLVFSYLLLKSGFEYYWVFLLIVIFEVVNFCAITLLARRIASLPLWDYVKNAIFPCMLTLAIAVVMFLICSICGSILSRIAITVMSILIEIIVMWTIGLSADERKEIVSIVK